jgi:hypothetical protein
MAAIPGWHGPVHIGFHRPTHQVLFEKSIGLSAAIIPTTFYPTKFSPRLRDAKTLNSFGNGGKSYLLRVPRGKQRGQDARDAFSSRLLLPEIGEIFELHVADVRQRLKGHFAEHDEIPMFPSREQRFSWAPGFEWHCTGPEIGFCQHSRQQV